MAEDALEDAGQVAGSSISPGWEHSAEWWIDGFTEGADPEYRDQIMPMVAAELAQSRRIVDIGCGEGQASRLLERSGADVFGVDPTVAQIATARGRGGGPQYARAAAEALPFADAVFDGALAVLVLEHLDDLETAVAEIARVLRPGGRFCLFLNHPVTQTPGSGWIDDQILDPPEQYWRIGPYLVEAVSDEQVDAGVFIRFVHRPLSRYLNTCIAAGLRLEHMAEPAPPESFVALAPEYGEAATIPRLLYLRFVRDA
jgi:SAM-dependent methyltransferase